MPTNTAIVSDIMSTIIKPALTNVDALFKKSTTSDSAHTIVDTQQDKQRIDAETTIDDVVTELKKNKGLTDADKKDISTRLSRALKDWKDGLAKTDIESVYDDNNPSRVVAWAKARLKSVLANEIFGLWGEVDW